MRQAVMGVLRWRDIPGTRSSMGGSTVSRTVSEVNTNLIMLNAYFKDNLIVDFI